MKKRIWPAFLALALLLSGCGNIVLERSYSVTAPHSDTYWENEGTDTLRADSYPDLVNALMMLLGEHTEDATVRLYSEGIDAAALLEQAAAEVQQETALGAYLLEYITYTLEQGGAFASLKVHLDYRRTQEEQDSVIHATSTEALPDLLRAAYAGGQESLAVRIGYFATDRAGIAEMVEALSQELSPEAAPWTLRFYPDTEDVGIVEVILQE